MKSINKLIVTLLVAVCASAQAQSDQSVLNEINELTRAIRQATVDSTAPRSSLIEARNHLEDALDLIESSSGYNGRCFDFAYEKYFLQSSSATATEKALAACRKIADVPVAKFAYEKYFLSLSATSSMDKAVLISGENMKGKLNILKLAYEKYFISLSSTSALDLAYLGSQKVRRGSEECLEQLYKRYFKSYSAKTAMDKAFEGCAQ